MRAALGARKEEGAKGWDPETSSVDFLLGARPAPVFLRSLTFSCKCLGKIKEARARASMNARAVAAKEGARLLNSAFVTYSALCPRGPRKPLKHHSRGWGWGWGVCRWHHGRRKSTRCFEQAAEREQVRPQLDSYGLRDVSQTHQIISPQDWSV